MTAPEPPVIRLIPLDDLAAALRTVAAVADNYETGGSGHVLLIEACHLIEIEVTAQHGQEAWAALTGWTDTPDDE